MNSKEKNFLVKYGSIKNVDQVLSSPTDDDEYASPYSEHIKALYRPDITDDILEKHFLNGDHRTRVLLADSQFAPKYMNELIKHHSEEGSWHSIPKSLAANDAIKASELPKSYFSDPEITSRLSHRNDLTPEHIHSIIDSKNSHAIHYLAIRDDLTSDHVRRIADYVANNNDEKTSSNYFISSALVTNPHVSDNDLDYVVDKTRKHNSVKEMMRRETIPDKYFHELTNSDSEDIMKTLSYRLHSLAPHQRDYIIDHASPKHLFSVVQHPYTTDKELDRIAARPDVQRHHNLVSLIQRAKKDNEILK